MTTFDIHDTEYNNAYTNAKKAVDQPIVTLAINFKIEVGKNDLKIKKNYEYYKQKK